MGSPCHSEAGVHSQMPLRGWGGESSGPRGGSRGSWTSLSAKAVICPVSGCPRSWLSKAHPCVHVSPSFRLRTFPRPCPHVLTGRGHQEWCRTEACSPGRGWRGWGRCRTWWHQGPGPSLTPAPHAASPPCGCCRGPSPHTGESPPPRTPAGTPRLWPVPLGPRLAPSSAHLLLSSCPLPGPLQRPLRSDASSPGLPDSENEAFPQLPQHTGQQKAVEGSRHTGVALRAIPASALCWPLSPPRLPPRLPPGTWAPRRLVQSRTLQKAGALRPRLPSPGSPHPHRPPHGFPPTGSSPKPTWR